MDKRKASSVGTVMRTDIIAALERKALRRSGGTFGYRHAIDLRAAPAVGGKNDITALVIGSTTTLPGGQVAIRFQLMDVAKQVQLASYAETVPAEQLRAAAHRIADLIYEKLTGDPGVFSTRIAFVVKQGKKYSLQVADADGYNAQSVIEYTEPIISPSWSPDGTNLAYVSFENKKPVVYV